MYRKEKDFVKIVNNNLKEEVTASRINILEVGTLNGNITDVLYEDKFKRQYKVWLKGGTYHKKEIVSRETKKGN